MRLKVQGKDTLKRELVDCLRTEKEVRKIIIFSSFLSSDDPYDLDIVVFQDSSAPYLPLAMQYRRKTRSVAWRIPLDILPLKSQTSDDPFLAEVAKGEVVYER
jgi:hypothetical protein